MSEWMGGRRRRKEGRKEEGRKEEGRRVGTASGGRELPLARTFG